MADLFRFDEVSLRKGDRAVLAQVSLTISGEGITAIVGASGAGKSTLLRCCNRLEAPTSGTISFRGQDLATLDLRAHRRCAAMVFQAPVTFPGTVLDNLRAVAPKLGRSEAEDALRRVALAPGLIDQTADSLSGGEAQRLVIARALTTGPQVLLADEATSALDATATSRLESLARQLVDDQMPVVWVTHDLAQVQRIADHLVVMRGGRVVWTGAPAGAEAEHVVADALREEAASDGS